MNKDTRFITKKILQSKQRVKTTSRLYQKNSSIMINNSTNESKSTA